ncbi:MAG: twin-arginine translocase subunit TatC [Candidatus Omnitrophota bacterium]|nr:twin-arginine translocase subunit TatC [Candidatus Omnitrophota bacterium]
MPELLDEVPPQTEPTPVRLTLAGHLEELRRRLGVSLAVLLLAIGLCASQADRLIGWLRRPAEGLLPAFAFFSPTEPLIAYLKVACLAGVILAMPMLLAQLWGFVRTGLTPRERSLGLAFVGWGSALFAAGAAFAYVVLIPVSLRVLLGIGRGTLEPVISIDAYLSFVTTLAFWCGVLCELPAVVWLLAKVGVVTPAWLRQSRPYAILVMVVIAALVTPTTDPVSLLLMTAPLLLLYEVSIWLARSVAAPSRSRPTPPHR